MVRTILKVDQTELTLSLPQEFVGKQIEVLAFVIDETAQGPSTPRSSRTFKALQLDTKGFTFNREEAHER